jgi:hypothetical protein
LFFLRFYSRILSTSNLRACTKRLRLKGLFFLIFIFCALFSLPAAGTDLHLEILSVTHAKAPYLFTASDGTSFLILSYARHDKPVRHVGAVFSHEGYRKVHTFYRNIIENEETSEKRAVFVLPYELAEEIEEVKYRLVVDGLWTRDPRNPRYIYDKKEVPLSVFHFPQTERRVAPPLGGPKITNDTVVFEYRGKPKQRVFVTGSFSHWDPFAHPMEEILPGEYRSAPLRLPSGTHHYYYIVNGEDILDPVNLKKDWNASGQPASRLEIE